MQNEALRRKQQELEASRDALMASEERYRNLYEFAPVAQLTLDVEGTITDANPRAARLLRVPRAGLLGGKFSDFVAPEDRDRWCQERTTLAAGAGSAPLELQLERPDGSRPHVDLALVVEQDPRQRQELRVAMLDVSQHRRMGIELRMAAAREVLAEQRERRRLAEEFYADIEQALALVGIKVAALQEIHGLADLQAIAGDLNALCRRIADFGLELCPTMLFDLGIVAAAQWLAEDVERRVGLKVRAPRGEEIEGVDEVARIVLFRTLRELLLELAGHSRAEQATVHIWREDPWVRLEVEGRGGGPGADEELRAGALLNVQQRMEQLGGRFQIRSQGGEDIRLLASLPLRVDVARLGEPVS